MKILTTITTRTTTARHEQENNKTPHTPEHTHAHTPNRHTIRQSNLLNGKHSSFIDRMGTHTHINSTIIGCAREISHLMGYHWIECQPIEIHRLVALVVVSVQPLRYN